MKALILAAGKGTRLYPLTINKPKGLLEIGNITILNRLVKQFRDLGIEDIIIVTGFKGHLIESNFKNDKKITFTKYHDYEKTNNLNTLWSVKRFLHDDIIISFADLLLDIEIIKKILISKENISLAVHTKNVLSGTMPIELENNRVKSITSTKLEDATGNFIGIGKFTKKGCQILIDQMSKIISPKTINSYYTLAIDNYVRNYGFVEGIDIKEMQWIEIDNMKDYEIAKSIFI